MNEMTTTGILVATVLALWKALEKLVDKLLERHSEKNGTSAKVRIELVLDRMAALHERMDVRLGKIEDITTVRDDEGRPKVWFPEAMIKRTHEAVRVNGEILHEVAKGLHENVSATKDNGKSIDDLRVAVQSQIRRT